MSFIYFIVTREIARESTLQQSTLVDMRAKSLQLRLIYFYSSYLRRST